ncbi:MAG TPA: hypothetical protein VMI75_22775 [Polyangiaceae bacterium]|nr:hypothetical protein [Polyangiaceae bacterium]
MKKPTSYLLLFLAAFALQPAHDAQATPTAFVVDQKVCTATGVATLGGTMTCDYATTTDRASRIVANVGLTNLSGGHLNVGAFITCEYVVENKNGTVSAPTAISSSNNPANNTTTTFVAAHAQASDFATAGSGPTCAWSISGTNARLTVTNNSNTSTADVTVWLQAFNFGSQ